jgi:hypothetical protein
LGFLRRILGGDGPDGEPAHKHLGDMDVDAPGWDAIDGALAPMYGDQEPKHYGTIIKFAMGGPDPLKASASTSIPDRRPTGTTSATA